jgi:hypothetical protein
MKNIVALLQYEMLQLNLNFSCWLSLDFSVESANVRDNLTLLWQFTT